MRFIHFEEIDSTNLEARRLAEEGQTGPVWISADAQTVGKGRRGREWVSKTGNLYCTGLYLHPEDLASAARLSFVAAIALAETLEQYIDPDLISIKWPNDVLVDGKKIAGILLESGTSGDKLWIAIGMGVNLMHHPENTERPATHLLEHIKIEQMTGPEPIFTGNRPVLATLAARFDHWRDIYLTSGFADIKKAWAERAMGLGETVTARLSNREIVGLAMGLDDDGALRMKLENGEIEKIHAGDVFFSPTAL